MKNDKKAITIKGYNTTSIILLIFVVGIIAVIIMSGTTSTYVAIKETDDLRRATILGKAYLFDLQEKAVSRNFYNSIASNNFPPIPLGSNYTDAGEYSVSMDSKIINGDSKKITISFRNPSAPSFAKPIVVLSTIIKKPYYNDF